MLGQELIEIVEKSKDKEEFIAAKDAKDEIALVGILTSHIPEQYGENKFHAVLNDSLILLLES